MSKINKKDLAEYTPDPVLEGLPDELKDPKIYKRTKRKILKARNTGHEHKHIITWQRCGVCQNAFNKSRHIIKKLGFKSYHQYLKWDRVMDIMLNEREVRLPLK
jgi:hypothetical protein